MRKQSSLLLLIFIGIFLTARNCSEISLEYSEPVAVSLIHYAATAGCGSERIKNWSCSVCGYNQDVQDITIYENDKLKSQAYTAYSKHSNQIILAFRGSVNAINYLSDFSFTFVKYPNCESCYVHYGFNHLYRKYNNATTQGVLELKQKYPTASIAITGHSLGAALAVLAGLDLQKYTQIDYIYNFGQPRIGNKAFSEHIMKTLPQIKRVVHDRDIVPHLPPRFLGYHHESQEVWYNANSTSYTLCNPNNGEDPKCMDSVLLPLPSQHTLYLNVTIGSC